MRWCKHSSRCSEQCTASSLGTVLGGIPHLMFFNHNRLGYQTAQAGGMAALSGQWVTVPSKFPCCDETETPRPQRRAHTASPRAPASLHASVSTKVPRRPPPPTRATAPAL